MGRFWLLPVPDRICYSTPPPGAVYRIPDVTMFGPSGEILPGYTDTELNRPFSMGSGGLLESGLMSVTGNSAAHPYAERARVRLEVEQNGSRTIVAAEHFVIHPPQTARLLEFSTLPVMGADPVVLPVPVVPSGQPVTVRWNVVSASRVILDTSLNITPSDGTLGRRLVEVVKPVGSRTFPTPRSGGHIVMLQVDDAIKKSLSLSVR